MSEHNGLVHTFIVAQWFQFSKLVYKLADNTNLVQASCFESRVHNPCSSMQFRTVCNTCSMEFSKLQTVQDKPGCLQPGRGDKAQSIICMDNSLLFIENFRHRIIQSYKYRKIPSGYLFIYFCWAFQFLLSLSKHNQLLGNPWKFCIHGLLPTCKQQKSDSPRGQGGVLSLTYILSTKDKGSPSLQVGDHTCIIQLRTVQDKPRLLTASKG